ncbi:unnamed protein product [Peniophora sp. CBMAI 1063]|nr:unnamed protein product [Peniophora sp. CBMAI 1063]
MGDYQTRANHGCPKFIGSASDMLEKLMSVHALERITYGLTCLASEKTPQCYVLVCGLRTLVSDVRIAQLRKLGSTSAWCLPLFRFRKELRRTWLPSLEALRSVSIADTEDGQFADLLAQWQSLGTALELDEKKEREQFDKYGGSVLPSRCSWKQCKHRSRKPLGRLLMCKGCGEAAYCGRPCQVSHWKTGGHKQECRRIKGA